MGCLNVRVTALHEQLGCIVTRIGEGIKVLANRVGEPLKVLSTDIAEHLAVRCNIVCTLGDLHYINVSPEEVQWITDDIGIVYTVESDTNWIIVTA